MSNLTTRAGKGSPLTNNELDANFTNLNADKVEIGGDLSGTPTAPIVTKVQGQSFSSAAANVGEKLVWNGTAWAPATDPSGEPIGHADKSESSIGFNAGTRTFTISPVSASFVVWCKGVKHTYTSAQTVVIPNTTGLHFIYFNASGVLSTQMTYFTWAEHAPTAYIYWNATTQQAVYFGDERHGIALDWQTHEYLHRTRGAAIANGFLASGYTLNSSATDAATQIAIESGTFFDEDMKIDIVSTATPTAGTYQQNLLFPAKIPVLHLQGTSWVMDAPTDFPFKQGTSRPQYNSVSGGVWSTADVGNNQHATTWILATNNLTYPVIAIIGQSATDNLGEAEAFSFADLTLPGFPSVEFRPLYKLIYKASDGYANSVNARLESIVDLRSISAVGAAANPATDHGNLSGLSDDDHPQYVHTSEVRTPSAAVKNSFFPSQVGQTGKYLSTDGTNTVWEPAPSGSLSFTGDVTGSGSTGSSVAMTLAASGVVAGQYTKVTVDSKGRVTAGTGVTSADVTSALGYTPYNATNPAGYTTNVGTVTSVSGTGTVSGLTLTGSVTSSGSLTLGGTLSLTSGNVTTALGFTPYNATNPSGYISGNQTITVSGDASGSGATSIALTLANSGVAAGTYTKVTVDAKGRVTTGASLASGDLPTYTGTITSGQVTTALGYTPYNATNPSGYTNNTGTVTSVSGTGTVSGLTLTGTVTGSGSLTLGGTLSLTSGQVTTALGYTPYNSSNPSGYITSSASITGNAATATNSTQLGGFSKDYFVYGDTSNTGSINTYIPDGGIGANAIARSCFFRDNESNFTALGIHIQHANNGGYGVQIGSDYAGTTWRVRAKVAGTWGSSATLLTSGNYNSYSPTLTGSGASGTWGINVTGTASSISGYNNPTTTATANTIAYRTAEGDIAVRELIMGVAVQDFTPSSMVAVYPTTNQAVKVTAGGARNFLDVPTRSGGNASGTWGISITGSAGSATTATRSTIEDTRAAQRTPNNYDDYRASYEFTNQIVGSDWHTAFTMQGWHDGYAAWQIIGPASTSAHENFYLRSGINTTWNSARTILHSGNYSSYSAFSGLVTSSGNNGFANATYFVSVRNPIWSFGNASSYGISYYQGSAGRDGTDTITLHPNGSTTATGATFATNSNNAFVNNNVVLNAANYTSYSPSLTGSGASGTWGIAISGNAATASKTTANSGYARVGYGMAPFYNWGGSNAGAGAPSDSTYTTGIDVGSHPSDQAYGFQIASNMWNVGLWTRSYNSGFSGWVRLLDTSNYTSYSPSLTGSGASGTWGISITGNAATLQGYQWSSAGKDIRGSDIYADSWLRNYNSGTGLYNQATANHWYSDGQYWNVGYSGTTGIRLRNGHAGTILGYLYGETSGNFGLLHNGGGWAVQVYPGGGGNLHGGFAIGGYTPLTAANYTSYSPPYSGGTLSGTWYFNSSRDTSSNSPPLQAYSSGGGGAIMSFHRGGYYAVNMGLDSDNVFRIGGWSAATNRLQMDMSGNLTMAGLIRAGTNVYIDQNYGHGHVGLYDSYRYQGVFFMGDAYKMSADGTSLANMYGIGWSHPNAGGAAGNLTDHGMLIINNGSFRCAISNSIVASGNITAYSDERLKKNWRDMPDNFVERLAQVRVGCYERIDDGTQQVGVSAQSLQPLLPEAIQTAKDEIGTLSVSYGNAAMASAVELAKELVMLKRELAEIKSRLH